jgi:hypothetical protein
VTLEIVYEGRTHNAEVTDKPGMDAEFQDVFSDYNIQERLADSGLRFTRRLPRGRRTIKPKPRTWWRITLSMFSQRLQGADRGHLARGRRTLQGIC